MKRKFFAAFLSLCMVMSLVPMTALAAEESWTEVSTAGGLSSALGTGGNIKLTANITVTEVQDWTVGNGVNVVLDLNGHTISSSYGAINYYLITINGGSLTIKDNSESKSGKIEATDSSGGYGIQLKGNGSSFTLMGGTIQTTQETLDIYTPASGSIVNISGGKLVSTSDSVFNVRGSNTVVNITGGDLESEGRTGVYISNDGDPDSIVFNMTGGKLTHTSGMSGAIQLYKGATLTIGGTAEITSASSYAVQVQENTILNVQGGTVSSERNCAISVSDESAVNVSGGEIQTTSTSAPAIQIGTDSNATISGGTITGKKVLAGNTEDITVTGGTFTDGETKVDVSKYFPKGAILTQDTTGAVTPSAPGGGETVIAEVNSVPYNSIRNAINAAQDGDSVVLKATSTSNDSIVISDGRSIKLDMNGFDIGFAQRENISLYHGELNITGKGMLYEESPWFGPVMIYGAEENVSIVWSLLEKM